MSCACETHRSGRRRLFRALPSKAESQTGVLLVTVLFAIVIGRLALKISEHAVAIVRTKCFQSELNISELNTSELNTSELNTSELNTSELDILAKVLTDESFRCGDLTWFGALDQRFAALLHLTVAAFLIVASAVGYYNSRQLPKLNVGFCNLPLVQATLDIAMVMTYYLVVEFVEPQAGEFDARPEAVLVTIAFTLYALWDLANYRVSRDEYSQVALRKVPQYHVEYGYRRGVTLVFFTASAVVTIVYCLLEGVGVFSGETATVLMDTLLLLLLILYRLFKPFRDPSTHYRGQIKPKHPDKPEPQPQSTRITPDDLKELLPEIDNYTGELIKQLGASPTEKLKIRSGSPLGAAGSEMPLMLSAAQADAKRRGECAFFEVEVNCEHQKPFKYELTLRLTDFGKFVYSVYSKDEACRDEACGALQDSD